MRKTVQVAGIAVVLVLAVIAAVPAHVELTVGPVEANDVVVSGWIVSSGDARVSLDEQMTPWETRLSVKGLNGFFEAGEDGPVRVRARMFKGPLAVSELNLVGNRIWLMNGAGVFSGRALAIGTYLPCGDGIELAYVRDEETGTVRFVRDTP